MNQSEFVKWAKDDCQLKGKVFEAFMSSPVRFVDADIQTAWRAWQGCSALYAKLTAEPTPGALTLPGDFFNKGK